MSKETAMALVAPVANVPAPSTQENPVNPATTTTTPPESDSTRFAHLAKKEAEIVKDRLAFKKEQEALALEKIGWNEGINRIQEFEKLKQTDKIAAIKALGFDDTDIFNYFAAAKEQAEDPIVQATRIAKEEAQAVRDEIKAAQDKATQEQNERIISRAKGDITETIKTEAEKFEYCNFYGALAEEQVFELIKTAAMNDSPISIQEAIESVEDFYEKQAEGMRGLKKMTPKEAASAAKEAIVEVQETKAAPSKTITNNVTQTVASNIQRKETREEKRERLIEQLRAR